MGVLYPLVGIPYSVSSDQTTSRASLEEICGALKIAVSALRQAEIPFLLAGSLAVWARGGPEPQKDLDLMVRPQHADAAQQALVAAGMRGERPPEEWLLKAWNDDVLVDIIFGPSGLELNDEVFARGETIPILAVATPVMALEDVLVTKLRALDEHALDYGHLVAIARSLREQIDWESLWARTQNSPFARAFFALAEGLELAPPHPRPDVTSSSPGGAPGEEAGGRARVRVLRD
jgi:hypothetical protein